MTTRLTFICGAIVLSCAGAIAAGPADLCGPIEYPGIKTQVDGQGAQCPGFRFQNDCKKPAPWQGQWIWVAGKPSMVMFRKEITLEEAPAAAKAWLTADAKYLLYINGRLASRGPVDIGRDFAGGQTHHWFYDARDLSGYFVKGKNVVAAVVFRGWRGAITRGQGGFRFEAEISQGGREKVIVKSDATWRALPATQFPMVSGYDANKDDPSWRLPGFDDSAWGQCEPVADVWENLVPSEMPPLMEARYPALRIEGLANRTITADASFRVVFDRVLSGYPYIKVKGGKGATLSIMKHHVTLGDGEQVFEIPSLTEIVPAFTVEINNVKSPVEIVDVGAIFTSQPVEYRGSFACSDDRLNQIWKVSRWAVQICLQTHHLDSPNHQEPISDPGDYVIELMVNHYAFAQPWLARQDIRKFAWLLKDENYRNFHTSYSISWLQMLMDYYDYTGDKSLVEEMAPYVHELMDAYASWRGKNGIISEAPNYMFMDWVTINGFGCHHPPAVIGQGYLTAYYYHGMEMASRIASMMGDGARVEKYATLRAQIAEAFNRELWVDAKGLYRDGKPFQTSVKPYKWLPADKEIETFSPHVNLLAVLYDLAPRERRAAIVDKVMEEHPLNTQMWFMHWVFPAIEHAGLFDKYGTVQMRRWQINAETQSFREMWNGGDLSHGWCSTPLVQMSQRVLGVSPTSAGFKTLSIRPATCDLTFAKGSVPTPLGDVAVAWAIGQDSRLQLDVTIPAGIEADITPPTVRFEKPVIRLDGRDVGATVRVGGGTYHFEVTGKLNPPATAPAEEPAAQKPARESSHGDNGKDCEEDVVKDDLVRRFLARAEDHASHAGGGRDASAVVNGTTRNGQGGSGTRDDGKTFRGYGAGDWLTLHFKQPCDITEIRSFAGHPDSRASQKYKVLAAYASSPEKFVEIGAGAKACDGGASELRVAVKAARVVAVRLEFQNAAAGSFSVYREFNVLGRPATP